MGPVRGGRGGRAGRRKHEGVVRVRVGARGGGEGSRQSRERDGRALEVEE